MPFNKGTTARRIVAASHTHNGIMTLADFADYSATERAPVECDYRGYHIVSAPPPSSGGVVLCETLNILSGYPLSQLGFHSAQEVHYTVEALRRAFHDRNVNLGDPGFVKADVDGFISTAYAAQLRAGILPDRATPSASLGIPGNAHEGQNTTHFSIVDAQGNAVSLTLHPERLVRGAGGRRRHRCLAQRRDGRFLIETRLAQHVRSGRGGQQRHIARQASVVLDDAHDCD